MDVTSNDQLQASTLPPWRERWVRVQGLRVRVLDGGQGPAVLFLHGVGGWAENWRDILPVVARAGYRVLACDLPGFGHSEAPTPTRYFDGDSPFYVTFVSGLLDELRLHQVTLVGHSMGGAVAMMVAATEPWRVQRLVLIAPGGVGDDVSVRLKLLALPVCQHLSRYVPAKVVQEFLRANFHRPSRIPSWLLEEACRYGPRSACEMTRVLSQALPFVRQSPRLRTLWCDRIAKLQCPTLILWGRNDRTLPLAHLDRAKEVLPHACTDVIDDAGHLVIIEQKEEVLRSLLTFLWTTAPAESPFSLRPNSIMSFGHNEMQPTAMRGEEPSHSEGSSRPLITRAAQREEA